MKLEFLEDGLDGSPLILLYGGGTDEVVLLRNAIRTLSEGFGRQLVLSELPFVQSVDGCQLFATSANADLGVEGRAPGHFEWTLDLESWLQVTELLEPFCKHEDGVFFQYLNPGRGPEIIYSTARAW